MLGAAIFNKKNQSVLISKISSRLLGPFTTSLGHFGTLKACSARLEFHEVDLWLHEDGILDLPQQTFLHYT